MQQFFNALLLRANPFAAIYSRHFLGCKPICPSYCSFASLAPHVFHIYRLLPNFYKASRARSQLKSGERNSSAWTEIDNYTFSGRPSFLKDKKTTKKERAPAHNSRLPQWQFLSVKKVFCF